MRQLLNKHRGEEGFTLIEMMIVIAIIGILATIVIRSFVFLSTARDSKRISDIRTIQNYLELYYNAYGEYPQTSNWGTLATDLKDINVTVPQPATGYPYCYNNSSTYSYVLGAQLENNNSLITSSTVTGTCGVTPQLTCGTTNGYVYCVSP
ncbi:MAG: prepilin-type N-terminal cleavage/methylation domain-containing protein [Patescibacteria group bacterium]|nr:prepilin-type N-terminal cleavage/methylation domain-containing protein [Patescibacteria group bacterium]